MPGTAAIAPAGGERQRRARVVGDHRARRARDRVAGDDVVRVVVREEHALDLAAGEPRPEHRGGADAAEAQRAPVDLRLPRSRKASMRGPPRWKASPMRDDPLVERVDVGHARRRSIHAHAEERQVDHAQHGHAVLEQPEHHAAQRRAGRVVDRAVERVGDPHAPAVAGRRRRPPRRRSRSRASTPPARA